MQIGSIEHVLTTILGVAVMSCHMVFFLCVSEGCFFSQTKSNYTKPAHVNLLFHVKVNLVLHFPDLFDLEAVMVSSNIVKIKIRH